MKNKYTVNLTHNCPTEGKRKLKGILVLEPVSTTHGKQLTPDEIDELVFEIEIDLNSNFHNLRIHIDRLVAA